MKRILCGAVVAAAAFASVPAHAAQSVDPVVTIKNDENGTGVGTGLPGQPLFGAYWNKTTGRVCVGFSYQVPQCVTLPSGS
jgi:opacity protein-like surface antigen